MIRKIPEITSEVIHYLFSKAYKFENCLIITINDTVIIIIIIIIIIMIVIIIIIVIKLKQKILNRGTQSKRGNK